jgi:hypothetical protein
MSSIGIPPVSSTGIPPVSAAAVPAVSSMSVLPMSSWQGAYDAPPSADEGMVRDTPPNEV